MNDSGAFIPIERDHLSELMKRTAARDKYSTTSKENRDLRLAVHLNERMDRVSTVPPAQAIIVTNLPSPLSGVELMNSFFAVGGIRCYRMFSVHGAGGVPCTIALITFVTPICSKKYLSYVSKHGFFLGKRLPPGHSIGGSQDECIYTSPGSDTHYLFKRIPHVIVKPWVGPGKTDGMFITGDEGSYCNVSYEIEKEGATRSLTITPGIEPKELRVVLSYLAAELKVESCHLTTLTSTKEFVTTIRFCSVHDAVMVKAYLTSQKAFSGADGKIVKYSKSPTDNPIENLGWHNISKHNPTEVISTGRGGTPVIPEARNYIHEGSLESGMDSSITVGELGGFRGVIKHSEAEESDTDDDDREISFSLAKEAFLPYIPASPSRVCFTSLSHTPCDHPPRYLGPVLEKSPRLSDELTLNRKTYHEKISPKELRSKKDANLTNLQCSIVKVNISQPNPSQRMGSLRPGSEDFPSSFNNEIILPGALNKIAKHRASRLGNRDQTQDTPGAGVSTPQRPLLSKVETKVTNGLGVRLEKSALQPMDMGQVLPELTSSENPAENYPLDTVQFHDQKFLESWMDDF